MDTYYMITQINAGTHMNIHTHLAYRQLTCFEHSYITAYARVCLNSSADFDACQAQFASFQS